MAIFFYFQGLLSRDSLMTRRSSAFPGAEWTAMSSRMRSSARHRTSVGSSNTVVSLGLRYSDRLRVLKVEIELLHSKLNMLSALS